MAREEARINQVVDRLIALLEEIDGDESEWWTDLQTVKRFRGVDDLSEPMPAVLIHVLPSDVEAQMGAATTWRERRELTLQTLSKDPIDPAQEAARVSRDVRRRLRQLRGMLYAEDGTTLLAFDIRETPGELLVDPALSGAGFGSDMITIAVHYDTTAENP